MSTLEKNIVHCTRNYLTNNFNYLHDASDFKTYPSPVIPIEIQFRVTPEARDVLEDPEMTFPPHTVGVLRDMITRKTEGIPNSNMIASNVTVVIIGESTRVRFEIKNLLYEPPTSSRETSRKKEEPFCGYCGCSPNDVVSEIPCSHCPRGQTRLSSSTRNTVQVSRREDDQSELERALEESRRLLRVNSKRKDNDDSEDENSDDEDDDNDDKEWEKLEPVKPTQVKVIEPVQTTRDASPTAGETSSKGKTGTSLGVLESTKPDAIDCDTRTCIVCWVNPIEMAFIPCGHTICCRTCHQMQECPMCRQTIERSLRIYIG